MLNKEINNRINGIHSDVLIALELLIKKVGRKWKYYMRELKSVPISEERISVFNLKLKGLSEAEIHDLNSVTKDFIKKTTRPMIFEELRFRRKNGLLK